MATNKYAAIRYQALDKCFSNTNRRFYFRDLLEACQDAIYAYSGKHEGICRRQLFEDIKFMESEEGYSIPLLRIKDGRRTFYRYSDKNYSINQQPLSPSEAAQLHDTLIMLSRFRGIPQSDWMQEVITRIEATYRLKGESSCIISFDHNPYLQGLCHLPSLFEAILNHQILVIRYHPAFGPAEQYEIHPYHLKQYNTRWFLFGLNPAISIPNERITNMALDRIEDIHNMGTSFNEIPVVDFDTYFDDVFGVTVPYNTKSETIVLKIDRNRYDYIASKPIHHTQTVIGKTEHDITIRLELIPNYEFETLLFGFADSILIIEPVTLRKKITQRAKMIIDKNTY